MLTFRQYPVFFHYKWIWLLVDILLYCKYRSNGWFLYPEYRYLRFVLFLSCQTTIQHINVPGLVLTDRMMPFDVFILIHFTLSPAVASFNVCCTMCVVYWVNIAVTSPAHLRPWQTQFLFCTTHWKCLHMPSNLSSCCYMWYYVCKCFIIKALLTNEGFSVKMWEAF